jgi:hypothetical protein
MSACVPSFPVHGNTGEDDCQGSTIGVGGGLLVERVSMDCNFFVLFSFPPAYRSKVATLPLNKLR